MKIFQLKPPKLGFFEGNWTDQELRFQAIFREIQYCYFPRWKNGYMWRIYINKNIQWPTEGICRRNIRSIDIAPHAAKIYSDLGIKLILLHEAAHAVTWRGHEGVWFNRMKKIATQLLREGEAEMARQIMEDANAHFNHAIFN